jgi:7-cyano-7-deazaguanine synthase
MTEPAVLLASGGLDSTTLGYWLAAQHVRFQAVFVDYGQHCASTEFTTLCEVVAPITTEAIVRLDLADVYRNSSSGLITARDLWRPGLTFDDLYLPYRNLLLLSVGAAFAQAHGSSEVYAAFINSNHAKEIDCSARFFDALSVLLSEYGGVTIKMPFRELSKRQVVALGLQLGAPVAATYSCQASPDVPCGACPNCVDRLDALRSIV